MKTKSSAEIREDARLDRIRLNAALGSIEGKLRGAAVREAGGDATAIAERTKLQTEAKEHKDKLNFWDDVINEQDRIDACELILQREKIEQKRVTAVCATVKLVDEKLLEVQKAYNFAMTARVELRDAQESFLAAITEALGRSPDGDTHFSAVEDAQKQYLVFHGFGAGLKERNEPSIYEAGQRVLNNFRGQLRIHANKHGLDFPKDAG